MQSTDNNGPSLHNALNALAGRFDHFGRYCEPQLACTRFGNDCLGNDVLRCLIERGRDTKHIIRNGILGTLTDTTLALPSVRVPVLSMHERINVRKRFDRFATLDQNALSCCP